MTVVKVLRPVPIHSIADGHKAYLEIHRQGDRVRVQPTPHGKKKLNRFWYVWLRDLILSKTDHKHGFAVELYRGNVVVSSETTHDGLVETVRSIAAEIRPLKEALRRTERDRASRTTLWWDVEEFTNYAGELRSIAGLPKGAVLRVVNFSKKAELGLEYRPGVLRLAEAGMQVEYKAALKYAEALAAD